MDTSSKPMYERIYDALSGDIIGRKYEIGERVPSEKELAEQFNVSRITSKKALELLANVGLIVRKPGRGSFVAGQSPVQMTNTIERTNASKSSGQTMIGLVMTDFDDSYGTGLLSGIERASGDNDCFLVLRRSYGIPANEKKAIEALLELGVDGLIIFPAQGEFFSAEILKLVIEQFPLVLIDRHLKGVAATSIGTDNASAAKVGTDFLLDLGHKHIGFLMPPPSDTTAIEDRIEGFIQAHAERGVLVDRGLWINDITCTLPNSFKQPNIEKDIDKIKQHIQQNPGITALFAVEYNIAVIAKAALDQLGLRVPEDISILCFDSPSSNLGNYSFTHLLQDQEYMGVKALEDVLKLQSGETLPNKIFLQAKLVIGQSTASVREIK
ncbi:MAG: GntR family transcriptional regulator [Paenibacillaceae bacterium]